MGSLLDMAMTTAVKSSIGQLNLSPLMFLGSNITLSISFHQCMKLVGPARLIKVHKI